MKRQNVLRLFLLIVFVFVFSSCSKSAEKELPDIPGAAVITSANMTFTPTSIEVKAGQVIQYRNLDRVQHNIVLDGTDENVSGTFAGKAASTFSFAKVGTYTYRCTLHPQMKGSITVK